MRNCESFISAGSGRRRLTVILSAAGAILLVIGCSPPPRTIEVVGRVTYQGAPVEGAVVVFFAENYMDDPPAAGRTDATGHYELRTYFSAGDIPLGALPNDYVVCIQKVKRPDIERAQKKMSLLAGRRGDVNRYIAEEAVHDLWPDGVPDGWPAGYVPQVNRPPASVLNDEVLREKLARATLGIPLLPTQYADNATSGLRASVEPSSARLTFDFELTGEIDESAPLPATWMLIKEPQG